MRKRCKAEATHSVKFIVPAKPPQNDVVGPIDLYCTLCLCAKHAAQVDPEDIFGYTREEIRGVFMDILEDAEPDFHKAVMVPILLTDPYYLMYESQGATFH